MVGSIDGTGNTGESSNALRMGCHPCFSVIPVLSILISVLKFFFAEPQSGAGAASRFVVADALWSRQMGCQRVRCEVKDTSAIVLAVAGSVSV
jgi:hypothetical protein